MRLLIIDGDRDLLVMLARTLRSKGHEVETIPDGREGLDKALESDYDVVVADACLTGVTCRKLVRSLAESGKSTSVIIMGSRQNMTPLVTAAGCGANDYLFKPFSTDELLLRLAIAKTNSRNEQEENGALSFSNVMLDVSAMELRCGENAVCLTKKEAAIMRYLISNAQSVIHKEKMFANIWGFDSQADIAGIEVYLCRLRKLLHHIGSRISIESVRGVGYRMVDLNRDKCCK